MHIFSVEKHLKYIIPCLQLSGVYNGVFPSFVNENGKVIGDVCQQIRTTDLISTKNIFLPSLYKAPDIFGLNFPRLMIGGMSLWVFPRIVSRSNKINGFNSNGRWLSAFICWHESSSQCNMSVN
jgi:hypothetical protein